MRALIDTNVLLDVALNRGAEATASGQVLARLESSPGTAFVAWHTLSNISYILGRSGATADARAFIAAILAWADVAPVGTQEAKVALKLPQKDFEDCLQIAAAEAAGADFIITRNKSDFRGSPVPAVSPEEWLKAHG